MCKTAGNLLPQNNTLLITNLLEGEYAIHETRVDGNQGFLLDDTEYHVTLDSSCSSGSPYIIIHPNRLQEPDRLRGEVHISKIDEFGMMLDHARFSLAAYYGDYTESFDNNDLTQPEESGKYTGNEFYDEGTVRYGQVIFDGIPCTVDDDNNVQTWVHIHEIETPDLSCFICHHKLFHTAICISCWPSAFLHWLDSFSHFHSLPLK